MFKTIELIHIWSEVLNRWVGENEVDLFEKEIDTTLDGSRGCVDDLDLMLIPHPATGTG